MGFMQGLIDAARSGSGPNSLRWSVNNSAYIGMKGEHYLVVYL